MSDPIVVMGICGSYDLDSANGRMLEIILDECESLGAETVKWDHGSNPLPLVGAEGSWDDKNVKNETLASRPSVVQQISNLQSVQVYT